MLRCEPEALRSLVRLCHWLHACLHAGPDLNRSSANHFLNHKSLVSLSQDETFSCILEHVHGFIGLHAPSQPRERHVWSSPLPSKESESAELALQN